MASRAPGVPPRRRPPVRRRHRARRAPLPPPLPLRLQGRVARQAARAPPARRPGPRCKNPDRTTGAFRTTLALRRHPPLRTGAVRRCWRRSRPAIAAQRDRGAHRRHRPCRGVPALPICTRATLEGERLLRICRPRQMAASRAAAHPRVALGRAGRRDGPQPAAPRAVGRHGRAAQGRVQSPWRRAARAAAAVGGEALGARLQHRGGLGSLQLRRRTAQPRRPGASVLPPKQVEVLRAGRITG